MESNKSVLDMAKDAMLWMLLCFQCVLSRIAWALGPVCVVIAFGLIFTVIYVHVSTVLPHYCSSSYFGLPAAFHIAFTAWMAFNLPFNYFMCIMTSPGRPPSEKVQVEDLTDEQEEWDYCKYCECLKPERTHHCTVCNKCTLRMDHHCPWMANCVGHFNYKYFVLFLLYMTFSCFYIVVVTGFPTQYGGLPRKVIVPYIGRGAVEFCMLLCCSVTVAVGGMLIWHLYLISTQQTTIEFYQNAVMKRAAKKRNMTWVNPYDVSLSSNFDGVFGHNSLPWRWLMPSTTPPPGNGISFTIRSDVRITNSYFEV